MSEMFSRDLPSQFVEARAKLEPRLNEFGFKLAQETFSPEAFGSAHAEYRQGRRGRRLRLVWDGKDAALWLQVSPGGSTPVAWSPLEASATSPGSIPTVRYGGQSLQRRIEQLVSAVEEEFGKPHGESPA